MSGKSSNANNRNRNMRIIRNIRVVSQVAFIFVLFAFIKMRRPMNWMVIFLGSVVFSVIFARFYCGWICPISSVMQVGNWIGKKLKIQGDRVPPALRSGMFAYGMVALTFMLAFLNTTGKFKLPFLLVMVGLGFLVALRYPQETWHKYLCPYGVILRIPGRFARLKMNVDNTCSGCGLCKKVCPAEALEITNRKADIDPSLCLVCHECSVICPKNSITYGVKPQSLIEGHVESL